MRSKSSCQRYRFSHLNQNCAAGLPPKDPTVTAASRPAPGLTGAAGLPSGQAATSCATQGDSLPTRRPSPQRTPGQGTTQAGRATTPPKAPRRGPQRAVTRRRADHGPSRRGPRSRRAARCAAPGGRWRCAAAAPHRRPPSRRGFPPFAEGRGDVAPGNGGIGRRGESAGAGFPLRLTRPGSGGGGW